MSNDRTDQHKPEVKTPPRTFWDVVLEEQKHQKERREQRQQDQERRTRHGGQA